MDSVGSRRRLEPEAADRCYTLPCGRRSHSFHHEVQAGVPPGRLGPVPGRSGAAGERAGKMSGHTPDYDVFLSHSLREKAPAAMVAEQFREAGLSLFSIWEQASAGE